MTLDELQALICEESTNDGEAESRDWMARFTSAFSEWPEEDMGVLFLSLGMLLSHLGEHGVAVLNDSCAEMIRLLRGPSVTIIHADPLEGLLRDLGLIR